jgi:hypothetical protein
MLVYIRHKTESELNIEKEVIKFSNLKHFWIKDITARNAQFERRGRRKKQ